MLIFTVLLRVVIYVISRKCPDFGDFFKDFNAKCLLFQENVMISVIFFEESHAKFLFCTFRYK